RLSGAEIKMLFYSVNEPSEADEIEDFDEETYESKLGPIVARALSRAKQGDPSEFQAMKEALRKLTVGDHYLTVVANHVDTREVMRPLSDKIVVYSTVAFAILFLVVMIYFSFTK